MTQDGKLNDFGKIENSRLSREPRASTFAICDEEVQITKISKSAFRSHSDDFVFF
jgi:hypothetical protein